jgi:Ni/Fe-hydrogenase 1 B-type cytochrome subunit
MSVTLQSERQLFAKQKNSLAIRIWHWLTFLGFTASLITVLLGSTLFKTKKNISTVIDEVARKGGTVTQDQAWSVAHAYSDKLWDTHKIIGYVLCFLLLSRLLIEFSQNKEEKLKTRIQTALSFHPVNETAIRERNHYLLVKRGYLVFYVLFLCMGLTGLVLAFEDLEFLKPIHKTASSLHSFFQWGIYGYILLHLIGVIRADLYKNKGIVSGMINGNVLAD